MRARLAEALDRGLRVHAIAGLQGTGKSTLASQLVAAARDRGVRALALSIDDFYLGRRERLRLGRTVHPLCATRGPPGTHDVPLACEVLDALAARVPTRLPRFDKIADSRLPSSRWPVARDIDLVVFEGWFLKVPPQPEPALRAPLNRLEREEDPEGTWRRWSNASLARDYPGLWQRLPWMLFLQGPGFEVVPDWRWEQERTLQAAHPGRRAMDRAQVMRFVQFFERVSRHAMATWPALADALVPLDARRRPTEPGTSPSGRPATP
ncbi:MAG TPA: kinase [Xanthomonadaceae bacterium]|nr:kinase [Xanthomonadaceae bacterium]